MADDSTPANSESWKARQIQSNSKTLKDKVALISGSSSGIGAAIAIELSRRGASVVLNYPFPDLEREAQDVGKNLLTQSWTAICADLSSVDGPAVLAAGAVEKFGKIDILINNAGVVLLKPLEACTVEDWNLSMNLNVRGTFLLTKAVLPFMPSKESGGGGRIVNMCSATAFNPPPDQTLYVATKGAIDSITKSWAKELPPKYGVTVNSIAPGPVDTPGFRANAGEHIEYLKTMFESGTPVDGWIATVEDVSWAVAFLVEERSRWINGNMTVVTGGLDML